MHCHMWQMHTSVMMELIIEKIRMIMHIIMWALTSPTEPHR